MKVNFLVTVTMITLAIVLSVSTTQAEEKGAKEQSQNGEHHSDTLDMDQMMGMMHDCMKMHKDGKMCNHETMNKCEEKMSKENCEKMMKKMNSTKKKKK